MKILKRGNYFKAYASVPNEGGTTTRVGDEMAYISIKAERFVGSTVCLIELTDKLMEYKSSQLGLKNALGDSLEKHRTFSHQIQTDIGIMLINLNQNHLTCNFFGNEEKAKSIFGHWKINTFVESNEDIQNHVKQIKSKINETS